MKKILLIVLILFAVMAAGITWFVLTFDADRYRPLIVKELESAIGNPVTLDRVSLGWRGGIALELERFAIYPGTKESGSPVASLDNASVVVELMPLLKNRIRATALRLDGLRLHVIRDGNGEWSVLGLRTALQRMQKNPSKTGQVATSAIPFLVEEIQLKNGEIRLTDSLQAEPLSLTLRDLEIGLKHVSLTEPIEVRIKTAILSQKQNLEVTGRLHLLTAGGAASLEDLRGQLDLDQVNPEDLAPLWRSLNAGNLPTELSGRVTLRINRLLLDDKGVSEATGNLRLEHARFPLPQLGISIEDVSFEGVGEKDRFQINQLSGTLAGGRLQATGALNQWRSSPQANFNVAGENLNLDRLTPSTGSREPRLTGALSFSLQGAGQGLVVPVILQTLSGQGQFRVSDAVILNLNILQEVFNRLSAIPGVTDSLMKRLPESYKEKFSVRDTILGTLDIPVTLERGAVFFREVPVATDSFQMRVSGSYGLDGSLRAQAMLAIDPELSKAMIVSVRELQALTDREGRIQFPVNLVGVAPQISVMPDLAYIGTRLAGVTMNEMLSGLFKKPDQGTVVSPTASADGSVPDNSQIDPSYPQASGQSSNDPAVQNAAPANPYQDLLAGLLQKALTKKKSDPS